MTPFHILLLTRCPIHARRFHRFRVTAPQGESWTVQPVGGEACCGHARHRKLRIPGPPTAWPSRATPGF